MKRRRLVNLHTTGRFAGISVIYGVENGPMPLTDQELPTPVDIALLDGRFRQSELVGSTERTVFYREQA